MSHATRSTYRYLRAFGLSPIAAFAFAKLSRRQYRFVSINSLVSASV